MKKIQTTLKCQLLCMQILIIKGCVAHQLDIMMLSATEIDTKFNVNVMTGSTGIIMGAQEDILIQLQGLN